MSGRTQRSRREVLAGLATGIGGLAGCVTSAASDRSPVSMLVAGSLFDAVENGLRPSLSVPIRPAGRGSVRLARLIAAGKRNPDIASVSDVSLFDTPLSPTWYAEFATNAIALAYHPDTPGGRLIDRAEPDEWYRPLLSGDVSLGRTDPDLDPLGYRTLFALELATDYYETEADLREAIPERNQIYPETRLASVFEAGVVEAAFVYRSTAVERGYSFVDFPPEIDLSDPSFAKRYATATYEVPGGTRVRGRPIAYGSTARKTGDAIETVFEHHVTGDYLTEFGFTVPEAYPNYVGSVPEAFR